MDDENKEDVLMKLQNHLENHFNWKDKKILLYDGDLLNHKFFSQFFKKSSCQLMRETDEKKALDIIKNNNLDVILIELSFSYENRLELIRKIRKINDKVLVIVQTFMVFENVKKACFDAGCNYFFPKPLDFLKLIAVMDSYLPPPNR